MRDRYRVDRHLAVRIVLGALLALLLPFAAMPSEQVPTPDLIDLDPGRDAVLSTGEPLHLRLRNRRAIPYSDQRLLPGRRGPAPAAGQRGAVPGGAFADISDESLRKRRRTTEHRTWRVQSGVMPPSGRTDSIDRWRQTSWVAPALADRGGLPVARLSEHVDNARESTAKRGWSRAPQSPK
jgi:hypothetical protein